MHQRFTWRILFFTCFVRQQGKDAAVYYWPGSDVFIDGTYASNFYQYRKTEPIDVRTKQVGHREWERVNGNRNLFSSGREKWTRKKEGRGMMGGETRGGRARERTEGAKKGKKEKDHNFSSLTCDICMIPVFYGSCKSGMIDIFLLVPGLKLVILLF